jgi:2-succinyl-5-enolpyruvyl-6-hydroxy-3-cyclohexene-1-carboxylate synthase
MSSEGPANLSNEELAFEVIQACWLGGCREFVVCAGSRNSPLVLELLRLGGSTDELVIWSFFEERSAAFFALGRSKASGRPTAVVTTSGTAAAELLPAAVEAHYADIPLMLVTADRPSRFRKSGSPQSIEQYGIIKPFTEINIDISREDFRDLELLGQQKAAKKRWHVNVCFDEPLIGQSGVYTRELPADSIEALIVDKAPADEGGKLQAFVGEGEGLVVLAGSLRPGQGISTVVQWLVAMGRPIWAEASSGLREDDGLSHLIIRSGERYFSQDPPTKILRIGDVPSLGFWRDLEVLGETEVLSIDPPNGYAGLARDAQVSACGLVSAIEAFPIKTSAEAADLAGDRGDWNRICGLLDKYPQSEPAWMGRLSQEIPKGSLVYLGNSMPIREWNLAAGYEDRGLRCFASRGANGIDGQVSTFLGLTVGEEESWGLFGDLTTLYDLSAPWVMEQLKTGKRRMVVVNNGGGRIFSRLPHLAGLAEEKKTVTENRHQRGFGHWAAMWGLDYQKVVELGDLSMEEVATRASIVIELCPDPEQTDNFWSELAKAGLPSG